MCFWPKIGSDIKLAENTSSWRSIWWKWLFQYFFNVHVCILQVPGQCMYVFTSFQEGSRWPQTKVSHSKYTALFQVTERSQVAWFSDGPTRLLSLRRESESYYLTWQLQMICGGPYLLGFFIVEPLTDTSHKWTLSHGPSYMYTNITCEGLIVERADLNF